MTTLQTATTITFTSSLGEKLHGNIVKFDGQTVSFELLRVQCSLRASEVLSEVEISDEANSEVIYTGKAIVQSLIDSSTTTWCAAKLAEPVTGDALYVPAPQAAGGRPEAFLARWQNSDRLLPEYKLAVADLHSL